MNNFYIYKRTASDTTWDKLLADLMKVYGVTSEVLCPTFVFVNSSNYIDSSSLSYIKTHTSATPLSIMGYYNSKTKTEIVAGPVGATGTQVEERKLKVGDSFYVNRRTLTIETIDGSGNIKATDGSNWTQDYVLATTSLYKYKKGKFIATSGVVIEIVGLKGGVYFDGNNNTYSEETLDKLFKKGDKVKIVSESHGWAGIKEGDLAIIDIITSIGALSLKLNNGNTWSCQVKDIVKASSPIKEEGEKEEAVSLSLSEVNKELVEENETLKQSLLEKDNNLKIVRAERSEAIIVLKNSLKKEKAKSKIKAPTKTKEEKARHKAWDEVVIENILFRKMQLSYLTKMPMLLRGASGTGKSTMVRALAEEHGVPSVEFNFNGQTTVEHLLGHKILVGGDMVWEDGPLTDAVRNGKVFIGHELNSSSTEIQFIFNGLLELSSKGKLGLLSVQGNNGEELIPHEAFRFFGTYNPGYLGTKSFGTSLMSRFIGAEVSPLDKTKEAGLLVKLFPKLIKEINLLVELENQLREDTNFAYDVSTRDLIQTLTFISGGFSLEESVDATIRSSCQIDLEVRILRDKLTILLSNNN